MANLDFLLTFYTHHGHYRYWLVHSRGTLTTKLETEIWYTARDYNYCITNIIQTSSDVRSNFWLLYRQVIVTESVFESVLCAYGQHHFF